MLSQVIATTSVVELMNKNVIVLHPKDAMIKAKEVFDSEEFHHIPVVNDQTEIVGMLSRIDYNRILSCHLLFNKDKNESFNQRTLESLQVEDVMNKCVLCLKVTDGLTKAASIFRENRFHALPVVDDKKKLVGIITTFDLLIFAYK